MQFDDFFPFDFFDGFFNFFSIMFIIVPIIMVIIFAIVFVTVCRTGSRMASGFTIEPPSFVIPDRYQGRTRSDGTRIKTVRLPERCPSCGASLSHEAIDWTGPLEAKCNYCGGTVRATFEDV